ncbi:MAG: hypothetical protein ACU0BS_05605 [Hasllibacter sp.]
MRQRIIAAVLAAAAVAAGAAGLTAQERAAPPPLPAGLATGALEASGCPFAAADPARLAAVAAIAGPRAARAEAPFAHMQGIACGA